MSQASETTRPGVPAAQVAELLKPVPKVVTSSWRWNGALRNVNEALYSTYTHRIKKGIVTAPQMVTLLDELADTLMDLRENVTPTPTQDDKLGEISEALTSARALLNQRPPPVVRVSVLG
jgi:hypothetical protein